MGRIRANARIGLGVEQGPTCEPVGAQTRRRAMLTRLFGAVPVASKFDIRAMGADDFRLVSVHATDRTRRCERSDWSKSLAAESVATLLYSSEALPASGEAKSR